MQQDDPMTIDFKPAGRTGTATITVTLGSQTLAVEKLDLTRSRARERFTDRLCNDRPGIDREAIDAELLRMASEVTNTFVPEAPSPSDVEIDTSAIVRPDRFITLPVSGLAVPVISECHGETIGRWSLYLQWADSRRECVELTVALALPDNSRLFLHPIPSSPTPHEARAMCRWSAQGRQRWLNGNEGPYPTELFQRVAEAIAYFIDLPADHAPSIAATLTLWVMLTYVYPAFDAVPYLHVGGAMGSGKSRLFEVLTRLVFRPLSSSNLTGPALFRTLHSQGGTLLFDEAERLKQTNDPAVGEILSMLLAGYKRGGQATRLETAGDSYKTVAFDVYGPKALACIVGLPPALLSRCIPVMMFRAVPNSPKPRRRIDADPHRWQSLRDDLHTMALTYGSDWLALAERTNVCPAMHGRDFEVWHPLLAIAAWLDDHGAGCLLKLVQEHALTTIESNRDDQIPDTDETLLQVLADCVRLATAPTPGEILKKAREAESESFIRWTPRAVSSHLKRYGLRTNKSGGRKVYGRVTVDDLRRVETAYAVDLGVDYETISNT